MFLSHVQNLILAFLGVKSNSLIKIVITKSFQKNVSHHCNANWPEI